jgi:hypothetical protein
MLVRVAASAAPQSTHRRWVYNGKQVNQSVARKAQQEPEGAMEGTETAAAAEAP